MRALYLAFKWEVDNSGERSEVSALVPSRNIGRRKRQSASGIENPYRDATVRT
jgi:hypothetical protein